MDFHEGCHMTSKWK